MNKRLINFLFLFLLFTIQVFSQDIYPINESIDVQNYVFALTLNDDDNKIKGKADITVEFKENAETLSLDLIGKYGQFGMTIVNVYQNNEPLSYTHKNNTILIEPSSKHPGIQSFTITYEGVPQRGLVIDTTKFGQRSFFGDNWPNLARHWLPCIDHPSDKASVEFRITAPDHYDVVATGHKIEESHLGNGYKLTSYKETTPVAMKVATIGVTRFASRLLGTVQDIPVTAWVYPENRMEGFSDYAVAESVLNYYIENIGPYPYAKLANMQAKTQWGGLENAGAIAYNENSVTGNNQAEGLIAHEIAHQWFGNSATEKSWNHVWLSEGFATYFTILYQENKYGPEKRKEELLKDRSQIIRYYLRNPSPIVDYTIKDPRQVLSTNTYQKGGWVLNMLRHRIGDNQFWKGIRLYYKKYRDSNALTDDFRKIMEEVSGENLADFFQQWIFTKGYPELKWSWEFKDGQLTIQLDQIQEHYTFSFPLEIAIGYKDHLQKKAVSISERSSIFTYKLETRPEWLMLDPEVWLLFEDKNK